MTIPDWKNWGNFTFALTSVVRNARKVQRIVSLYFLMIELKNVYFGAKIIKKDDETEKNCVFLTC
jgi:hypothetical protein